MKILIVLACVKNIFVRPRVVTLNGETLLGTRITDRERKQMVVHAKQLPLKTTDEVASYNQIGHAVNRQSRILAPSTKQERM